MHYEFVCWSCYVVVFCLHNECNFLNIHVLWAGCGKTVNCKTLQYWNELWSWVWTWQWHHFSCILLVSLLNLACTMHGHKILKFTKKKSYFSASRLRWIILRGFMPEGCVPRYSQFRCFTDMRVEFDTRPRWNRKEHSSTLLRSSRWDLYPKCSRNYILICWSAPPPKLLGW